MKKTLIVLVVIFTALVASYATFKNFFVARLLESQSEALLGVNIVIKKLDISFLANYLRIEGLTIENPPGFGEKEFAYIPSMAIACHPLDYLKNKEIKIYFLGLDIDHINIIKNKQGLVNLKTINPIMNQNNNDAGDNKFSVEIFRLNLKDVYYFDYQSGKALKPKVYNVNIKNTLFSNLNNPNDIVDLVVLKILSNTAIGQLINMSIAPVANDVKDVVVLTGKVVTDSIKGVFHIPSFIKGLFTGH